jgi:hypothetical protein
MTQHHREVTCFIVERLMIAGGEGKERRLPEEKL